jgi:Tol biopolymer transport system component
VLGEAGPALIDLPVEIGQYYDYAPASGRILYASHFADTGAGPGNLAVSDLRILDLASSETRQVIKEDLVVNGRWLPNGEDLAYILATPTTYELRLRRASGDDLLLASDLNFNWSVSPTGRHIAFSRESGYETPGDPGLYVVDLAGGQERRLSDIDKQGRGSIEDRPFWSPDGKYVFFSTWGASPEEGGKRLLRAAIDGSDTHDILVSPGLADEWWAGGGISSLLVDPTQDRFVGLTGGSQEPFGPPSIMVFEVDPGWQTIIEVTELLEASALIDWDVAGAAIWAMTTDGKVVRVGLPE